MTEFTITEKEEEMRIDAFLLRYLNGAPSSFVHKMLRKKNITLNGKKAEGRDRLHQGDTVRLYLSDETIANFRAKKKRDSAPQNTAASPEILYEDADILIANKPSGLLCQSDRAGGESLAGWLCAYRESEEDSGFSAFSPSPAHRIDRNTSGIVLCGLSRRGLSLLTKSLRERRIEKIYRCLVFGRITKGATETAYYEKDEATNRVHLRKHGDDKNRMVTGFIPVSVGEDVTELNVTLLTGRPHQIRAHMAYLGHPVVGDPKYGDPKRNRLIKDAYGFCRQYLHAESVTFPNDAAFGALSGRTIRAALPDDLLRIREKIVLGDSRG